jgi:hypothetical protein
MRARKTCRAGVLRPRDHRNSVRRSSLVNEIERADFMGFTLLAEMKPETQS